MHRKHRIGPVRRHHGNLHHTCKYACGRQLLNFELEVVDSATAQESTFSPASTTITVLAAVVNTPIPSATSLDVDQAETITGIMPSTGVSPYTYDWLVFNKRRRLCPNNPMLSQQRDGPGNGQHGHLRHRGQHLVRGQHLQLRAGNHGQPLSHLDIPGLANCDGLIPGSPPPRAPRYPQMSSTRTRWKHSRASSPPTGTSPYSYTWHRSTDGGAYAGSALNAPPTPCRASRGEDTATCAKYPPTP